MTRGGKIRISLVEYLNSVPLGWAFLTDPFQERFQVIPSTPARCAEQLARGQVEIGLIPSIEFQRIPHLQIIPNVAIGSQSRVKSVVLVFHRGRQIRSIAVDSSSRTSVVLADILLKDRMGLNPDMVSHAPNLKEMLKKHDGALIIGDAALQASREEYEVVDLAETWIQWQRLPFVFAFWACRMNSDLPGDLSEIFRRAKDLGLAARGAIAAKFSRELRLSEPFLMDYLTRCIDYDFGDRHIEGLQRFYELAAKRGYLKKVGPLSFVS